MSELFATSVCRKCGQRFTISLNDCAIFSGMTPRSKDMSPGEVLRTWPDWVWHISNHCEECRIEIPPRACVAHYNKIMEGLSSEKDLIDQLNARNGHRNVR